MMKNERSCQKASHFEIRNDSIRFLFLRNSMTMTPINKRPIVRDVAGDIG